MLFGQPPSEQVTFRGAPDCLDNYAVLERRTEFAYGAGIVAHQRTWHSEPRDLGRTKLHDLVLGAARGINVVNPPTGELVRKKTVERCITVVSDYRNVITVLHTRRN